MNHVPHRAATLNDLSRAVKFDTNRVNSVRGFVIDSITDYWFYIYWALIFVPAEVSLFMLFASLGIEVHALSTLALSSLLSLGAVIRMKVSINKDVMAEIIPAKTFFNTHPKSQVFVNCYDELVADKHLDQIEQDDRIRLLNQKYGEYVCELNKNNQERFEQELKAKLNTAEDSSVLPGIESNRVNPLNITDGVQDFIPNRKD